MSGILRLESLTKGNTLKQGDKTPLKYRLFDADGEKLNIAGKTAKVRLVYPDFLTIGYEKDGLTVSQDDTVTFTIDGVIPSRIYHVEIIVDGQFIFPSRSDESKFTVDKSSLGTEANIIEIVGKDVLINAVKSQVDTELQPLVTSLEAVQQSESDRVSAEAQRKADHANRSAEFAGKADKIVLKNLIENGDFRNGLSGWTGLYSSISLDLENSMLKATYTSAAKNTYISAPSHTYIADDVYYVRTTLIPQMDIDDIRHYYNGVYHQPYLLNPTPNTETILSNTFKGVSGGSTTNQIRLFDGAPNVGDSILIKDSMLMNLTNIFGAGNEPTKEEMDDIVETIGYIDGEYGLNNKDMFGYLMKGIGEKVTEEQEDIILSDRIVTPVKTTFFSEENLFNPETAKVGYFTSNGSEIANGSYYLSDYIPVTQGQTYIMPATHSALGDYFDSSKSIVSTIARHHMEQPFADKSIFKVPNGVRFVKVSGFRGGTGSFVSTPINEFMLVPGNQYPSSYIPFGTPPIIKNEYLPSVQQGDMVLADGIVTPVKTTFFNKPNLFNPETAKKGYFTSNGVEIENDVYYVSDYIPVEKGKTYIVPSTPYALGDYFDINNSLVSSLNRSGDQPYADKSIFTVPAGVRFVRVNGYLGTGPYTRTPINEFMMIQGEEYPSEYIPFGTDPKIKSELLPITTHSLINPLHNKKVVWNGDSIMGASPDSEGGWAGRIAKKNSMISTNYAVGGGTIATGTYSSDNPRHWISKSVESMDSEADYVILEGGRNDWAVQVPLGEISDVYTGEFDDTTFCGALESMLSKVRKKYLGKKVGFIIVYKMEAQHYPYGSTSPKAEVYYDKAREILEKWSVPYLDLFKSSNLTVEIPEVKAKYFADQTHINAEGYKVTADQVERWMMTL